MEGDANLTSMQFMHMVESLKRILKARASERAQGASEEEEKKESYND